VTSSPAPPPAATDVFAGPLPRRGLPRPALRLAHRVLSAGRGDVAQLRGWDRLITWRAHATPRARWTALKTFLKLPARAARGALRDVERFGDAVAARAGVSRRRQVVQLWWLAVRYGLDARAYLDYQLYRADRWPQAGAYLGLKEVNRVTQFIKAHHGDRDADVLYDKRRFDEWCREHELPTVSTVMELEQGRVTRTGDGGESLPPCDLFAKPSDGAGGSGARRWRFEGGVYVDDAGRVMAAAEVLAELLVASRGEVEPGRPRRILVQRRVSNHRALAPLTLGGLCTIRLHTYRWPGAASQLLLAVYKMPVGHTAVDNFRFGGIVAPVDVETGRLGQALTRSGPLLTEIERHPDTGAVIAGYDVPCWQDAVRLVRRAHDAVPSLATVGWDVAILDDGPVLVEGNTLPNVALSQMPSGRPLGGTPLVACLNAHLRECFVPGPRGAASARTPSPVPRSRRTP